MRPIYEEPIYSRVTERGEKTSPMAHDLFQDGETVRIHSFALHQQMRGANHPIDNLFRDINLFDYTEGIETIDPIKPIDLLEVFIAPIFLEHYDPSKPFMIPISGGLDSRLNLTIIRHLFSSSQITCIHEIKNEEEKQAAEQVCAYAGHDCIIVDRKPNENQKRLIFDPNYYLQFSGIYRDNIPRWHDHLAPYQNWNIVGMGADSHKGYAENEVEYHKKLIVSGYAKRTWYFANHFNVAFPWQNPSVIQHIFSMPREWKQRAQIPKTLMQYLEPEMLNIPMVSHHEKPWWNRWKRKPANPKDRLVLDDKDVQDHVLSRKPQSPVSRYLRLQIENSCKNTRYKLQYCVQLYLYFTELEKCGLRFDW